MPCRCAPGHVVHHIPVSLLYWPWKSDVLKICTPAMQKASFSQKWTFYARAGGKPSCRRLRAPPCRRTTCDPCWCCLDCCFVPTEWLLLLFHGYKVSFVVFSIYSNLSFHIHFYQCFFMIALAVYSITPRGHDVWVVKVAILCAHHACFIKNVLNK